MNFNSILRHEIECDNTEIFLRCVNVVFEIFTIEFVHWTALHTS